MLLSLENQSTCYDTDGTLGHYTKGNKPHTQIHIMYKSSYMMSLYCAAATIAQIG